MKNTRYALLQGRSPSASGRVTWTGDFENILKFLERRVTKLNDRCVQSSLTRDQRNAIESEIRAALIALDHYQKAITLERQVISRA